MRHAEPSELAGITVLVTMYGTEHEYVVEDWWDRVSGESWMFAEGNPACLNYALRTGISDHVPLDDEVLYGKVDGLGHLVHRCEVRR